jgi:hypothetical protein
VETWRDDPLWGKFSTVRSWPGKRLLGAYVAGLPQRYTSVCSTRFQRVVYLNAKELNRAFKRASHV